MITEESKNYTIIKGIEKDPVRSKVRKYKNLPMEKFASWIEAGEGNFIKTKSNGKYRDSCNTLQAIRPLKKCDSCGDVRKIISHCDKIDCSSCFSWTAYNRANRIVEQHLKLEEGAKKRRIRVGKPSHIIFSPKKNLILYLLIDSEGYAKLEKKFKEMLGKIGLHSGTLIFHLRSIKCRKCGKDLDNCYCGKKAELYKAINPHFHIFCYGFVDHISKFKEKFPNWNYMNKGKLNTKEDLFRAVFYAVSKSSIWRKKSDGKLLRAYKYFGFLKTSLKKIKEEIKFVPDKCKCNGIYHYLKKGYEIKGDLPKFDESLSIKEVAKKLGIKIIGLSDEEIEKRVKQKVLVNGNLEIIINNKEVELGKAIYYRKKIRHFKLINVRMFKKAVKQCRKNYLEQKRELRRNKIEIRKRIERMVEGTEYG